MGDWSRGLESGSFRSAELCRSCFPESTGAGYGPHWCGLGVGAYDTLMLGSPFVVCDVGKAGTTHR